MLAVYYSKRVTDITTILWRVTFIILTELNWTNGFFFYSQNCEGKVWKEGYKVKRSSHISNSVFHIFLENSDFPIFVVLFGLIRLFQIQDESKQVFLKSFSVPKHAGEVQFLRPTTTRTTVLKNTKNWLFKESCDLTSGNAGLRSSSGLNRVLTGSTIRVPCSPIPEPYFAEFLLSENLFIWKFEKVTFQWCHRSVQRSRR